MKPYDRVRLSEDGLRHYLPRSRLDWKSRRGVILWKKQDGDKFAVVWDGTDCEVYVYEKFLEVE